MTRRTLVLTLALFAPLVACGGTRALPWDVGALDCAMHEQCDDGEACVMGTCTGGRLREPMSVEDITATQWYRHDDGSCRFDEDCGPWVCDEGACVSPEAAGITLPPRADFAFWDLSCRASDDCGDWYCIEGFCNAPDRLSPQARPTTAVIDTGSGSACLGDDDCGSNGECVWPGYCHTGRSDEPMTWDDIPATATTVYADMSCNYDTDCGPHVCDDGWCRPHELAGRSVPLRGDLEFFDGSCIDYLDCGPWECRNGYCREPGTADEYRGDPDSSGQASTGAIGALGGLVVDGGVWEDGSVWGDYDFENEGGLGLYGFGTGAAGCLANEDCGDDQLCAYPGYCEDGIGDEPFDLTELAPYVIGLEAVCFVDLDCGPWQCVDNACELPSWSDQAPARRDVRYFDFSCAQDDDCGSFSCEDGWCRP